MVALLGLAAIGVKFFQRQSINTVNAAEYEASREDLSLLGSLGSIVNNLLGMKERKEFRSLVDLQAAKSYTSLHHIRKRARHMFPYNTERHIGYREYPSTSTHSGLDPLENLWTR